MFLLDSDGDAIRQPCDLDGPALRADQWEAAAAISTQVE
jgi:hypothetical protein